MSSRKKELEQKRSETAAEQAIKEQRKTAEASAARLIASQRKAQLEQEYQDKLDEALQNKISINMFNLFDKLVPNKPNLSPLGNRNRRIREYMTFELMVILDMTHDVINMETRYISNEVKQAFLIDLIDDYKEKMFTYIKNTVQGVIDYELFFQFIKQFIYYTGLEHHDKLREVFELESAKYLKIITYKPPGAGEKIGYNLNIYLLNALEAYGLIPVSYSPHISTMTGEVNPLRFLMKLKGIDYDPAKKLVMDLTVDKPGRLSYLTSMGSKLGAPVVIPPRGIESPTPPTLQTNYYTTPGKLYDITGDPRELLDRGGNVNAISVDGKNGITCYEVFFEQPGLFTNVPWMSFRLEGKPGGTKLLKFSLNGTEHTSRHKTLSGGGFSDASPSINEVGSVIQSNYSLKAPGHFYNSLAEMLKKFYGDFLMNIWHGILADGLPQNGFFVTSSPYKKGDINFHLSEDVSSACMGALFGNLVILSNTSMHNLEGIIPGGTEFFVLPITSSYTIPSLPETITEPTRKRKRTLTQDEKYDIEERIHYTEHMLGVFAQAVESGIMSEDDFNHHYSKVSIHMQKLQSYLKTNSFGKTTSLTKSLDNDIIYLRAL